MTLLSFHRLTPPDQYTLILTKGIYLMDRQEPKYYIALYAVEGFYVELYFYKRNTTPVKVTAFESIRLLEPYLNQIDFSELLLSL